MNHFYDVLSYCSVTCYKGSFSVRHNVSYLYNISSQTTSVNVIAKYSVKEYLISVPLPPVLSGRSPVPTLYTISTFQMIRVLQNIVACIFCLDVTCVS